MPQLGSPVSTPAGMSAINPSHRGKLPAPRFLDLAGFAAATTVDAVGYSADLWAVGEVIHFQFEPSGVRRVWNGAHARTCFINDFRVLLASDSSVVQAAPVGGVDGDYAFDEATGNIWSRAAGVWNNASSGKLAYLGPLTSRAALPKLIGSSNGLFGHLVYRVNARCNRITFVDSLAGNPAESMKSFDIQYPNGFGDIRRTVFFEGQILPVIPASASVSPLGPLYVRCPMGDIVESYVDLPRYVDPGEEITFKNFILETSHQDPRQYGYAGTKLGYANFNKSREDFFYMTGAVDQAAWEVACDTPGRLTSLAGAQKGDYGWRPHNLCGVITEESVMIGGDSKNHGQDVNGRYTEDSFPKIDSQTGSNGECCSIFRDYGCMNGGILTEKALQLTDVSTFAARRKLAEYTSQFIFAWGVNDYSADAALQNEATSVARYTQLFAMVASYLITPKRRMLASTMTPNPGTSDAYLTTAGQSPAGFILAQARVNGAIRQHLVGNNGFVDPANAVTDGADTGILKVAPNARRITTGSFTLHINDAAGTMVMTAPTAVFKPQDADYPLTIFGARYDGGDVLAECLYVSSTQIRLIVRNSHDDQRRLQNYDFSQLFDGSGNITINAATNNIGMGGWWLTTDTLHYTKPGEQLMYEYNRAQGYSVLH